MKYYTKPSCELCVLTAAEFLTTSGTTISAQGVIDDSLSPEDGGIRSVTW